MTTDCLKPHRWFAAVMWMLASVFVGGAAFAQAQQPTAFQQALAQIVARDDTLSDFYAANGYQSLWLDKSFVNKQRVRTLMSSMSRAGAHGLPTRRHNPIALRDQARAARSPLDQAKLEVAYTRAMLAYARDVKTGVLEPRRVVEGVERNRPGLDQMALLNAFVASAPENFFAALPPQTPEYAALFQEKLRLERQISKGWGAKMPGAVDPGQTAEAVQLLRARLKNMGYDSGSNSAAYDDSLVQAVAAFQADHGLEADGVVGRNTVTELNKHPVDRLASVIVAMERERWMNIDRGDRHVWVNIPDFTAKVIDQGQATFETRTVVGKDKEDHRSPEFSDRMDYIVVNPTWNVPRTIAVKEYLPMLKQDPNAVSHLQLLNKQEQVVSRGSVDFSSLTEDNFPFRLKEPPSLGNALGTVKFMFPNRYNIYLHDTPHKSLFSKDLRAYSHGCIRLNDPHDFAYTLLQRQNSSPREHFHNMLSTRQETTVDLRQPVPVHIVYRTAFRGQDGAIQYRRDVYERDQKIFDALQAAGVSMRVIRS